MSIKFFAGADPEVFVGDQTSVRSIIGKIGGTKQNPIPLEVLGDGFAVQEDNVALEFNIPACGSKADFINNLNKATSFLENIIKTNHGLHFIKESAISFPKEEMYDPAAFVFGCEPDYNAWTRKRNPRPKATDPLLRSCGGHVHIGVDGLDPHEIGKGCDLILGVPSVMMDKGDLRKQLYGKHGAIRIKPYGVEYRVLSNFWIFEDKYKSWVWDGVERVLGMVSEGYKFDDLHADIEQCIDNNNKELASKLIDKFNLAVV